MQGVLRAIADFLRERVTWHRVGMVIGISITLIALYVLYRLLRGIEPGQVFRAIKATELYRKHTELFDAEALAMQQSGELAGNLRTLKMCTTAADSKALARRSGPFLVMAGSGMCTGGRILHHLRNHLADPSTLLLMVGYQSRGSVGRALADGAKEVRVGGARVPVRAKTHVLGGLSGHAAQSDLLHWFGTLAPSRPRVVLTHGEEGPRRALRGRILEQFGLRAEMPRYREVIEF